MTCSCTIGRVGLSSQFDITVIEVVQDAYLMVQQLNASTDRLGRAPATSPPTWANSTWRGGEPGDTTTEADWKSTATDGRLSDTAQLLHTEVEYRPRADVFPRNYVNGWLIYELPVNRPAYLVWNYNWWSVVSGSRSSNRAPANGTTSSTSCDTFPAFSRSF